jgi:hypothetical protein
VADETADNDSQQTPGEWLAPSVAAARLGVSQRTLDRRIASGKVTRRIRPNGTTQVWLPLSAVPTVTDEMAANDGQEQAERALALVERVNLAVNEQVRPLIDLVERQQAQLLEQAAELGRLRSENAVLQARQTMADEMAATLQAQAPKEEPKHAVDRTGFGGVNQGSQRSPQASPVDQPTSPPDPAPRRWWQRLLGG